jgi:hypothetical protein
MLTGRWPSDGTTLLRQPAKYGSVVLASKPRKASVMLASPYSTTNRKLACGDAPSISGKSCDEYPLASTYQGLAAGGERRTFPDCNINAPTNVTGPIGASACMITGSENNAQGGIMARFYYDNRVLEGDPYRVGIGS